VIHRLEDHLIAHWDAIVGDRLPRPRTIHWMKFGAVTDFPRKYTYLYGFLDGAGEASLVLKITDDRTSQAQLIREFDQVNRIRARVSPAIAATIPEALAGLPFGAYWIGVEEVAGGERFLPVIDLTRRQLERRVSRYVQSVLDWVTEFASCGRQEDELDAKLFNRCVAEPLARLRSFYRLEQIENRYLEKLATRLDGYRGRTIGAVAMHGDLWPGNIYVHDGGLRIIDWTDFRERDISYHDLFCFLDSFVIIERPGELMRGGQAVDDYSVLAPIQRNWMTELAATAIDDYVERLHLDRELVRLMLPMYYVTMSTRRKPVDEASVAVNHKFRRLLATYIRKATHGGRFRVIGPWSWRDGDEGPDLDAAGEQPPEAASPS